MLYESTRGGQNSVLSAVAIKKGIAPDGGLYVPENGVKITLEQIDKYTKMTYQEIAIDILRYYLDDYSVDEINECVNNAYTNNKFDNNAIAPVIRLNENVFVLELWHGPTCAFKDMALQLLPHLLVKAVKKTGETSKIVILVATSGDTGKAALEGFKDVDGTEVIVFFPNNGVSEVQKLQMVTQEGGNVTAIAVEGNFDDTQNGVKSIFTNIKMNEAIESKGFKFSSANSINWGRLVPQIVYYFSSYAELIKSGEIKLGEKINFVVPTGNFGNILAAYYAVEMGLPVNKLICASNDNNVLTDFIKTGVYDRNRDFKKTISPSMDILISSNLERLLFEITEHNSSKVNEWMEKLRKEGRYEIDNETKKKISKLFWASYTSEADTIKTIECIFKEYEYVLDTHTAVGVDVYDKYVISTADMSKTVIVSTASPFKFTDSVVKALFGEASLKGMNEFDLLEVLSKECNLNIPTGLKGLNKKSVLHKKVCSKNEMNEHVLKTLEL